MLKLTEKNLSKAILGMYIFAELSDDMKICYTSNRNLRLYINAYTVQNKKKKRYGEFYHLEYWLIYCGEISMFIS